MDKCMLMLVVLLGTVQVHHRTIGFSISESYASTGSRVPETVDSEQEIPSNNDKEDFNPAESEPYQEDQEFDQGDIEYGEEDMEQSPEAPPEIVSTSRPTTTTTRLTTTTSTTTIKPVPNKSKWNKRPPKPKKPPQSSTNSGKGVNKSRKPSKAATPFGKVSVVRQPVDLDDAISVSRTASHKNKGDNLSLSSEIKSDLESAINDPSESPKLNNAEEMHDLGKPQSENGGFRLQLQNKLPAMDEKPESYDSIIKRMGEVEPNSPSPQRHNPSGLKSSLPWGIANFKFSQGNDDNQFSDSNEFGQVMSSSGNKPEDDKSYFPKFPNQGGHEKSPFFVGKRKKIGSPEYKGKFSGGHNHNHIHPSGPFGNNAYNEPMRDTGINPYMMAMMRAYPPNPGAFGSSSNNANYKWGGGDYSGLPLSQSGGGPKKKSKIRIRNSGMYPSGNSSPFSWAGYRGNSVSSKSPSPWEAYARANINLGGGYPNFQWGDDYPQWDEVNGQSSDDDGYQFEQHDGSPSDYQWGGGDGGEFTPGLSYPSRNYKNSYQYPKGNRQNPYMMYGATLTLPFGGQGTDIGRSGYWDNSHDQTSYPTYGNINEESSWYGGGGESGFDEVNNEDGGGSTFGGANAAMTKYPKYPPSSFQNLYGGGQGNGMGHRGYSSQFGSESSPSNNWAGGNLLYGAHPFFRQFMRPNVASNNNKQTDYLKYLKAVSNMAHWRAGLINSKNQKQQYFRKKKATRTQGINVTGIKSYPSSQRQQKQQSPPQIKNVK